MNRLVKSEDKKLFGVCGGIGEWLNIDATLIRFVWICAIFFGGVGILTYILLAILMPEE